MMMLLLIALHAHPSDRILSRCMVYLPAMRDVRLRHWCEKQSRRMP